VGFDRIVFYRVDSEQSPVLWDLDCVTDDSDFDLLPPVWTADPVAFTTNADVVDRFFGLNITTRQMDGNLVIDRRVE
jgi:hypothetical protein